MIRLEFGTWFEPLKICLFWVRCWNFREATWIYKKNNGKKNPALCSQGADGAGHQPLSWGSRFHSPSPTTSRIARTLSFYHRLRPLPKRLGWNLLSIAFWQFSNFRLRGCDSSCPYQGFIGEKHRFLQIQCHPVCRSHFYYPQFLVWNLKIIVFWVNLTSCKLTTEGW